MAADGADAEAVRVLAQQRIDMADAALPGEVLWILERARVNAGWGIVKKRFTTSVMWWTCGATQTPSFTLSWRKLVPPYSS